MYDRPFRWWVQSVMPLVFDDSLSYYEVLAKLTKYIEGLTGDVDQIEKILETIEGIEDVAKFTEMLENIKSEIGDLANLSTQTKSNLVSAINEVALKADIAYWKPPTGIPESDLSQEVQDKLNKTGSATEYIINNVKLKASPNNNSPSDLGLGTYTVPSGGIPWDTLSQDVKNRINAGGTGGTTDYTELINKPQINGHTLNAGNNTAESLGIGTYSKPSAGIPESDLSAEVQEKLNTSGGIADNQESFVASRDYEAGELLYINGVLYKTNVKILAGTTMVPGNNIETTDISAEIERINGEIDALQSGSGPDSWSLVANVTAQSSTMTNRFFEYFNAISGEDYLFIVTPDSSATSANRYHINVNKKDGTVVYTEVVDINPQNQQRFTFSPTDTGEYYCDIKKVFSGDPDTTVKVELQYTASQGISELWNQVNAASQLEPRVGAVETLVGQQQQTIDNTDEHVEELENFIASYGLSGNIIEEYYNGDNYANNGITFTKNPDGSVSSVGTASAQARYYWLYGEKIDEGEYVLSGIPDGSGTNTFGLQYVVYDEGTTPSASDFIYVTDSANISVEGEKRISLRTCIKAGYADAGHTWRTALVKKVNENELNAEYNPNIFVPKVYTALENSEKALDAVEALSKDILSNYDLDWKRFYQGSNSYTYIKSTPIEIKNEAQLTAVIPDNITQYGVISYSSRTDAQSGYDDENGTSPSSGSSGWITSPIYYMQAGYYIIVLRHTDRSDAYESEGDNITIKQNNLITTDDIIRLESKLPLFYEREKELADAINEDRDGNTVTFVLSADNHFNDYDRLDKMQVEYATQMSRISKDIGVDFIGTLGDIIEGFDDYLDTTAYFNNYHNINERRLRDMAMAYSNDDLPFIYVAGHHEMYPVNESVSGESFEQNRGFYTNDLKVAMYGQRKPGAVGTSNFNFGYRKYKATDIPGTLDGANYSQKSGISASYYFDVTKGSNKLRIIVVDSSSYTAFGYSPETVSFVDSALASAETNNIPCIILSHIPPRWQAYRNGAGNVPANESNYDAVIVAHKNIIKCYIHGHTHCDNIVTSATLNSENIAPYSDLPFPIISLACQKTAQVQQQAGFYIGNFHAYGYRNPTNYNGYCFTAINYHIDTGAIVMFRFGAGDSGQYPTWSI